MPLYKNFIFSSLCVRFFLQKNNNNNNLMNNMISIQGSKNILV